MSKLNYRSAWYSPRGFANEGTYLFGTDEEMTEFFDDVVVSDENCVWSHMKNHKSAETARNFCERYAKREANADTITEYWTHVMSVAEYKEQCGM